jgi:hypothetical protein
VEKIAEYPLTVLRHKTPASGGPLSSPVSRKSEMKDNTQNGKGELGYSCVEIFGLKLTSAIRNFLFMFQEMTGVG